MKDQELNTLGDIEASIPADPTESDIEEITQRISEARTEVRVQFIRFLFLRGLFSSEGWGKDIKKIYTDVLELLREHYPHPEKIDEIKMFKAVSKDVMQFICCLSEVIASSTDEITTWKGTQEVLNHAAIADGVEGLCTNFAPMILTDGAYDIRYLGEEVQKRIAHLMANSLQSSTDPYTRFLPKGYEMSVRLSGEMRGIGIETDSVEADENVLIVTKVFKGTPAERAEIVPGDILLAINGLPIAKMLEDPLLLDRIAMERETRVTLKLFHQGEHRNITLRTEFFIKESTEFKIENGVAFLKILFFGNYTDKEIERAFEEAQTKKVKALFLDLRGCRGGNTEPGLMAIASRFLPEKILCYDVSGENLEPIEIPASSKTIDLPVVILIDGKTASAAEVLAEAFQYYQRGLIVGQESFGKGVSTQLFTLPRDDAKKAEKSIGELVMKGFPWLTPGKVQIEASQGIVPDLELHNVDDLGAPENPSIEVLVQRARELFKT